jgi:DNA-binding transcriptional ArsR family regulator
MGKANRGDAGEALVKLGKNTAIDRRRLKRVMHPDMSFAFAHMVREHVFVVLSERVASPSEVAREIGVESSYVSYHFKALRERGLIELVDKRRVRGVWESFYRAKAALYIDDPEWEHVPAAVKSGLCSGMLQAMYEEATRALTAGTFAFRPGMHLSWTSMSVDPRGFEDLAALLRETLEGVRSIQAESAERFEAGEEEILTTVAILNFGTPPTQASDGELGTL